MTDIKKIVEDPRKVVKDLEEKLGLESDSLLSITGLC